MSRALRRLRSLFSAKRTARASGKFTPSLDATFCRIVVICGFQVIAHETTSNRHKHSHQHKQKHTSPTFGAATRTNKHRLRIGEITLPVPLQHRIMRKLPMYFSMVRRKPCWASLERRSASLMMTTLKRWRADLRGRARSVIVRSLKEAQHNATAYRVNLLCLCNLLDDLLHNHTVLIAHVAE